MEIPKFFILFVFGCNKYYCLQHVGNNKPGADSEMANVSNWRLVEDNPWLAHIVPSFQAAVMYKCKAKYCLWLTKGGFLPSLINTRTAVWMYGDKIQPSGREGAAIGWRDRYRHAGLQTLIMAKGIWERVVVWAPLSLSSTLNLFTAAHSSSCALSQEGFKCSAAALNALLLSLFS